MLTKRNIRLRIVEVLIFICAFVAVWSMSVVGFVFAAIGLILVDYSYKLRSKKEEPKLNPRFVKIHEKRISRHDLAEMPLEVVSMPKQLLKSWGFTNEGDIYEYDDYDTDERVIIQGKVVYDGDRVDDAPARRDREAGKRKDPIRRSWGW